MYIRSRQIDLNLYIKNIGKSTFYLTTFWNIHRNANRYFSPLWFHFSCLVCLGGDGCVNSPSMLGEENSSFYSSSYEHLSSERHTCAKNGDTKNWTSFVHYH